VEKLPQWSLFPQYPILHILQTISPPLMKSFIIALVFCLIASPVLAQSSSNPAAISFQRGAGVEVIMSQKNYGMGIGGILGRGIGKKVDRSFTFGLYADVFFMDHVALGPRAKVSYNYLDFFGVNMNASNWYSNGINDFRITPEINLSFFSGIINVFFGRSISLSKSQIPEIGNYRVGLSLNLVGAERE
jgi:hypothetical protein